jgi:hypothetical protein
MKFPLELVMLGCAELYLIIARSQEITILAKKKAQRKPTEQEQVDRGLFRSLLMESLLFVPCSVGLLMLIILPLMMLHPSIHRGAFIPSLTVYGSLGLISYQFPFAVIKRVVLRLAYKTLVEFKEIADKEFVIETQEWEHSMKRRKKGENSPIATGSK